MLALSGSASLPAPSPGKQNNGTGSYFYLYIKCLMVIEGLVPNRVGSKNTLCNMDREFE